MKNYEIEIIDVKVYDCENSFIVLKWSANIGFGELTIYLEKDGKITADTEYMSKEFLKQCLIAFYKKIEIIGG